MTILNKALSAWSNGDFGTALKSEMELLRSDVLPIAHAIDKSNQLDDSDLGVIINEVNDDVDYIYAKVGVFFAEIVNCCTCSGNGMVDEAYCELQVTINKVSGEANFTPL